VGDSKLAVVNSNCCHLADTAKYQKINYGTAMAVGTTLLPVCRNTKQAELFMRDAHMQLAQRFEVTFILWRRINIVVYH
jgi:hypothetical protein